MALFDINKLKNSLQDAVDNVTTAVKDGTVTDAMDSVASVVKSGGGAAVEAVTVAVKDAKVADRVSGVVENVKSELGVGDQTSGSLQGITAHDALRVCYYLMAADGQFLDEELDKFDALCHELGVTNKSDQDALASECQAKLGESASSLSPLIPVITCVDRVLYEPTYLSDGEVPVPPKLLVWELLAIAYSDGSCDDVERELIGHIAKIVGVDETRTLEMEGYVATLLDLEREEAWIKTTSQPYLVIESVIKDIETRKSAVFDGAKALITL